MVFIRFWNFHAYSCVQLFYLLFSLGVLLAIFEAIFSSSDIRAPGLEEVSVLEVHSVCWVFITLIHI